MKMTAGLFKNEIKLLVRNPLFYFMMLFGHGILALGPSRFFTSIDAANALKDGGMHPLILLTALLGAAAGRHHRAAGADELFLAAPHREWEPAAARLAAVWSGSLFLLATMAVHVIFRQAAMGLAPVEAAPFAWVLAGMTVTALQAGAVGLLLGVLVPSWWAIAAGIMAYWLLVGGGGSSLVISGRNWLFALADNSAALLFTVHPDLGGFPLGRAFLWGTAFSAGLVFLAAAGAVRFMRPRSRPFRPLVAGCVVLGLAVAVGASFGFGRVWNGHYAALAAGARQLEDAWDCCGHWPDEGPRVEAYDLEVDLDPEAGKVNVSARLTVTGQPAAEGEGSGPEGGPARWVFTLAREMNIAGIFAVPPPVGGSGGSGDPEPAGHPEPLQWERAASGVLVELPSPPGPGETVDLLFEYEGSGIPLALTDPISEPKVISYIRPEGSLLPGGGAWYPLPGSLPLEHVVYQGLDGRGFNRTATFSPSGLQPGTVDGVPVPMVEFVDGPPADYTVTVNWDGPGRAAATIPLVAEETPSGSGGGRAVFAGTARRVTIAYGDFITEGDGAAGSPVYHVAPRYEKLVDGHRAFIGERLAFYNSVLPVVDPDGIQIIGAPLGLPSVDGGAGIVMTGAAPWAPYVDFAPGPALPGPGLAAEHEVLALWWPIGSGSRLPPSADGTPDIRTTEAAARGMALYMHSLFRRHHLGEEAFKREKELREEWVAGFTIRFFGPDFPPALPSPSAPAPPELSRLGAYSWIENHAWLILARLHEEEGPEAATDLLAAVHAELAAGRRLDLADVARLAGVDVPGEPDGPASGAGLGGMKVRAVNGFEAGLYAVEARAADATGTGAPTPMGTGARTIGIGGRRQ